MLLVNELPKAVVSYREIGGTLDFAFFADTSGNVEDLLAGVSQAVEQGSNGWTGSPRRTVHQARLTALSSRKLKPDEFLGSKVVDGGKAGQQGPGIGDGREGRKDGGGRDREALRREVAFPVVVPQSGDACGARMRRAWLLVVAVATLTSVTRPSSTAHATPPALSAACGDLLAEAKRKPAGLVFIRCMTLPDQQGRPLRATYRVAGKQAAAVEATLNRTAGLALLRRSCCHWDGPAGSFTDMAGRSYMISMASGETMVRDRRQWPAIPDFIVIVDRFTEEI